MENKHMNKILIFLFSLITGCLLLTSCSDWTDDESVDIKQPTNPNYSKYLENLRAYKKSDHKVVYAWFDNSEKAPYSRGQHISDIPDSVDVVTVMYPDALADFEVKEIGALQKDKGMKVLYTISYDVIKKAYEQMVKDETDKDPAYQAPAFLDYLSKNVEELLTLSSTYNYDGIIVGYKGQSTVYMTTDEKTEYITNQNAFISKIKTWYDNNNTKMLVYEGSPQFLLDKSLLTSCEHIILNTIGVASAVELSIRTSEAMVEDVPTDRFVVVASTTSLDVADKKTGYYGEDRALIEAAYWVTEAGNGYTKAGLGIYNIQNDYYNISQVYQYAKKSINIMNPTPTN